jgi:hypothetical protein
MAVTIGVGKFRKENIWCAGSLNDMPKNDIGDIFHWC